jgi:glycosyltransferase involved in cell wall biosynthesis
VAAVRAAQRATGAQIVHSHLAWTDIVCLLAFLPVPHVSTEHGIAGDSGLYETSRTAAIVAASVHTARMQRMAATICVSQATAEVVRQRWHPPTRMPLVVVPNGVDRPEAFLGQVGDVSAIRGAERTTGAEVATERPPTVGFLGRFEHEKRPDLLLAALAHVRSEVPEARLSMAGEGSMRGELETQAHALGLADAVQFPGWVDSASWLEGVDVLAVTSVWENCSYAILEALANGVGVVASPVGGNPELLPTGALADPADPEAFAAALTAQLRDPQKRPALPDGYPTIEQMAQRTGAVYAQVRKRA